MTKTDWEYERDALNLMQYSRFSSVFELKKDKNLHQFFEDVDEHFESQGKNAVFKNLDGTERRALKHQVNEAMKRFRERWKKGQPAWDRTSAQYGLTKSGKKLPLKTGAKPKP